jgi:hypothetical protein
MFLPAPLCFLRSKLSELRETIAKLHPYGMIVNLVVGAGQEKPDPEANSRFPPTKCSFNLATGL